MNSLPEAVAKPQIRDVRFVRVLLVRTDCGESVVWMRPPKQPVNDRFGDLRCDAATGPMHVPRVSASAKVENPRSVFC